MKKASQDRVIITGLVHAPTQDLIQIKRCFVTFMGAAWGDYELPKMIPAIILAEGFGEPTMTPDDIVNIQLCSIQDVEMLIAGIEAQSGESDDRDKPDMPYVLVGFGSKEFCQAVVHFWATSKSGDGKSWGLHLIRKLSVADWGDALWYDSQDATFKFGDLGDMYHALQEGLGIVSK